MAPAQRQKDETPSGGSSILRAFPRIIDDHGLRTRNLIPMSKGYVLFIMSNWMHLVDYPSWSAMFGSKGVLVGVPGAIVILL
jgi:hypothetical protein